MPAPILHIDVRATHWPTLPEGAQIPLCPCDGDQPHDHYTTDATKVTCQACRDELEARWMKADREREKRVERGEECPGCGRREQASRVAGEHMETVWNVCGSCNHTWADWNAGYGEWRRLRDAQRSAA